MGSPLEALSGPWPWYVAGPLIGLVVPILLLVGGKAFGISSSFRQICAATVPGRIEYLRSFDWRADGWRLVFVAGILLGGVLASTVFAPAEPYVVDVAEATRADLQALGLRDLQGLVPPEIFRFEALGSLPGLVMVVLGGFLVGFGTRYAGGCTSGHGITGLAALQPASLIAVVGFFAGGVVATHFLLPLLF